MKASLITVVIIISSAIWFAFSISTQIDVSENQISKEYCTGGVFCPGASPIPYASVGNRKLEIALRVYSNSSMPSNTHYLWFRFFDANTNQTIRHVSFLLTITRQNQLLFKELLHTHTGILNAKVISITGPKWNVTSAAREPILNGWMPYNVDEPIVIEAPLFNDTNSIYHLNVQMYTIDRDNNVFAYTDNPNYVPNFNFYLSTKEQNQIIIGPNLTVPEFPFVILTLFIGTASLIVFYRIRFRR